MGGEWLTSDRNTIGPGQSFLPSNLKLRTDQPQGHMTQAKSPKAKTPKAQKPKAKATQERRPSPKGQRRPQPEDLKPILEHLWEGKSLRHACRIMGLHGPAVSDWLHGDQKRREQYIRACESRAEAMQERVLEIAHAAALGKSIDGHKVDPAGTRAYIDAIKWAAGRMAPKTVPIERRHVTFGGLSNDQLASAIEAELSGALDDDEPAEE